MRLAWQPGPCSRVARVAATLLALSFAATHAEDPPPERTAAEQAVLDDHLSLERRAVGLLRLRVSYPQRVSFGVGAIFVRQPADFDCRTVCGFRGPMIQLEPGLDGVQLGVGYARIVGERKDNPFFLSSVYVGFGLKGVLLRTWEGSALNPDTQTLAGVEATYTVTRVHMSVGVLRSLSNVDSSERWVATAGIGWGF